MVARFRIETFRHQSVSLALKFSGALLVNETPVLELVARWQIADLGPIQFGELSSLPPNHIRQLWRSWAEFHLFCPRAFDEFGNYAPDCIDWQV